MLANNNVNITPLYLLKTNKTATVKPHQQGHLKDSNSGGLVNVMINFLAYV